MANPTQQQTLQQKRAAHAWARINDVSKESQEFCKKYGARVRGLPALIQSDGLGQTLAFLKAVDGRSKNNKGNTPEIHTYRHIQLWASSDDSQLISPEDRNTDFLEWLLKQSTTDYRRATAEVLAYLSWIKRFAEAKGWQDEGAAR